MACAKLLNLSCIFVTSFFRKKCSISPLFISTLNYSSVINFKMNAVYFQNEKGQDKFSVKFCFNDISLNLCKVFNFERSTNETVSLFLNRLNNKVGKLLEKRINQKIKKGQDLTVPEISSEFLLDDKPLPSEIIFEDFFNEKFNGNLKLRVHNNDYDVIINSPLVDKILLPKVIRVGSIVYPVTFDAACTEVDKCTFTWFKSVKKSNWIQCGEGFIYIPKEEDCNNLLKLNCIPANEFKVGPETEVVSDTSVVDFPGCVEIKKRQEYTKLKCADDEIRIVSYNILADLYLHTKEAKTCLFTYCEPSILELDYRKDLLNIELFGYNADLICLQEVDKKLFDKNFHPILMCKGYDGVYHEKEGTREGCAFFYDTKKFKLLQTTQYFLTKEILNNPILQDLKEKIKSNEKLLERLLNLPTQVQVGVLECLTRQDDLIVSGNMHLYFHPDADHIRLLQGLIVFRILQNTMENVKAEHPNKHVSLLLCGDFNSSPDCGFHKFLTQGFVDENEVDWKSKEDEVIENLACNHSLKMKSACGTPKYTNYTNLFKECIDYIYFQTDRLEVKSFVPFPEEEILQKQTAIPSEFFPSDHLALIADLKFKS